MNLRKLREKTGLTQEEFWGRVGMSQSGGSRLENENRNLPEPVRILLTIAYGDSKDYSETIKDIRR